MINKVNLLTIEYMMPLKLNLYKCNFVEMYLSALLIKLKISH